MPTGNCRFPEHHPGPSAKPVIGWVVALGLGALIITHLHAVELVLIVLGILIAFAVPVLLLWHNHGSAYDPDLEHQAAVKRAQMPRTAAHSVTATQSRAVPVADRTAALEAAPTVVHNHLHLHGVTGEDMAGIVRHAIEPPQQQSGASGVRRSP